MFRKLSNSEKIVFSFLGIIVFIASIVAYSTSVQWLVGLSFIGYLFFSKSATMIISQSNYSWKYLVCSIGLGVMITYLLLVTDHPFMKFYDEYYYAQQGYYMFENGVERINSFFIQLTNGDVSNEDLPAMPYHYLDLWFYGIMAHLFAGVDFYLIVQYVIPILLISTLVVTAHFVSSELGFKKIDAIIFSLMIAFSSLLFPRFGSQVFSGLLHTKLIFNQLLFLLIVRKLILKEFEGILSLLAASVIINPLNLSITLPIAGFILFKSKLKDTIGELSWVCVIGIIYLFKTISFENGIEAQSGTIFNLKDSIIFLLKELFKSLILFSPFFIVPSIFKRRMSSNHWIIVLVVLSGSLFLALFQHDFNGFQFQLFSVYPFVLIFLISHQYLKIKDTNFEKWIRFVYVVYLVFSITILHFEVEQLKQNRYLSINRETFKNLKKHIGTQKEIQLITTKDQEFLHLNYVSLIFATISPQIILIPKIEKDELKEEQISSYTRLLKKVHYNFENNNRLVVQNWGNVDTSKYKIIQEIKEKLCLLEKK
jgi:hypothetical protein